MPRNCDSRRQHKEQYVRHFRQKHEAEDAARAQYLAYNTEHGKPKCKSQSHAHAVGKTCHGIVLCREALGTAKDEAVDNNQRDVDAQRLVDGVGSVRCHEHLQDGDKGCYDNDEDRNAHLVGRDALDT